MPALELGQRWGGRSSKHRRCLHPHQDLCEQGCIRIKSCSLVDDTTGRELFVLLYLTVESLYSLKDFGGALLAKFNNVFIRRSKLGRNPVKMIGHGSHNEREIGWCRRLVSRRRLRTQT